MFDGWIDELVDELRSSQPYAPTGLLRFLVLTAIGEDVMARQELQAEIDRLRSSEDPLCPEVDDDTLRALWGEETDE
jgi:hypothetical protein